MSTILPKSLLALTLFSLLFSSIAFILSLITFAIASLWLSVIAAVLTVLYHSAIFIISWRRALRATAAAPQVSISHTWPNLMCAAFILGTWVLALAVTLETTILGDRGLAMSEQNAPWNDAIQVAHSVSLAVQVLVFSSVLVHGINNRGIAASNSEQFDAEQQSQPYTSSPEQWKSEGMRTLSINSRPTTRLKTLRLKPGIIGNEITPFPIDLVLTPSPPNSTERAHDEIRRAGTARNYATSDRPSIIVFATPLKNFPNHDICQ